MQTATATEQVAFADALHVSTTHSSHSSHSTPSGSVHHGASGMVPRHPSPSAVPGYMPGLASPHHFDVVSSPRRQGGNKTKLEATKIAEDARVGVFTEQATVTAPGKVPFREVDIPYNADEPASQGDVLPSEAEALPGHAGLLHLLLDTWEMQVQEGFILSSSDVASNAKELAASAALASNGPAPVDDPTVHKVKVTSDPGAPGGGLPFRFTWMPHREVRGDVKELERRGIINPHRRETILFRDPRDPHHRHCFLCAANIAECNPLERLIPMTLAGREYIAGANFAWITQHHFTVCDAQHRDQVYSQQLLESMVDLHVQTGGMFRSLYNGDGAGASVPWHQHFHITTVPLPVEHLVPERDGSCSYPAPLLRFSLGTLHDWHMDAGAASAGRMEAHAAIEAWLAADPVNHTVNLLVAPGSRREGAGEGASALDEVFVYVFPRDKRRGCAAGKKGQMGAFEMAGDMALSAPEDLALFGEATAAATHRVLADVGTDSAWEFVRRMQPVQPPTYASPKGGSQAVLA
eukprot:jgi/Mesvir1/18539/Mv11544-RA.1